MGVNDTPGNIGALGVIGSVAIICVPNIVGDWAVFGTPDNMDAPAIMDDCAISGVPAVIDFLVLSYEVPLLTYAAQDEDNVDEDSRFIKIEV